MAGFSTFVSDQREITSWRGVDGSGIVNLHRKGMLVGVGISQKFLNKSCMHRDPRRNYECVYLTNQLEIFIMLELRLNKYYRPTKTELG